MKVINASYEIINPYESIGVDIKDYFLCQLKNIEQIGRTCYKSENNIDIDSYKRFIGNLIKNGHEAMIEHSQLSVRFIIDRGISHEIVRHRLASFAQESTRYCNYSNDKFGNELTFIHPKYIEDEYSRTHWYTAMKSAEISYFYMLKQGTKPQMARDVLPTSVKTELVMTANFREWRNFFKLRCDKAAHPQIREITIPLLQELKIIIPVIFDDIEV